MVEDSLEPARPIIDPHLHFWEILAAPEAMQEPQRFLLPEAVETIGGSGHNITHTVFVECHAMYRLEGPAELKPIGETEFVNGIAAMSASGAYGPCRFAHRIVANADLRLGERVTSALEAHKAAAGERFRGIRSNTAFSEAGMFGMACDPRARGVIKDTQFRDGARVLARMGLSLDVWCFHTQLDELIELATALPDLMIVLDHVGTPETLGAYRGREVETRVEWAQKIIELARRPNVRIKLGGLGMDISEPIGRAIEGAPSQTLAIRWRPYIETCIEAFTPQRAMFESNFPPDKAAGTYGVVWNAFKIIAKDYSDDEKDQLFRRTAARTYRIAVD